MKQMIKIVLCTICFLFLFYSIAAIWSKIGDGTAAFDTDLYVRYRLHLLLNEVPEHFVTFKQINVNNEFKFKHFRLRELPDRVHYDDYSYTFEISNGSEGHLYIQHDNPFSFDEISTLPEGVEDIREISPQFEGNIQVEDMIYTYTINPDTGRSHLYTITMEIDGVQYQFRWYKNSSDLPDEDNTFVGKLLHARTATQARDEFAAAIRSERPSQFGWKILFFGTPVVVVGGVVAFFVIRKKRAKAKENT